ncbi:histidine phosphotransferase [Pseudooceanicola sediminis]|uniref:Histidine phosphotransferase n=1 Tax=Pseudooceanicola sediminis TaxID=2211117 RepID=A0A399J605_9RHOB|nr:histidine phosphotransferase [Puniceibacterium sp. HSS470]RII40804.1 histidine phosphotransferase [Pseudooceanicola sediminis]
MHNSHLLASLIGSRICHDLISPVGAIQNGIELLALEGAVRGPEMVLISDSVSAASAKIRFLRVAFGLAGHGQKIGPPEVTCILDDLSQSGRVTFDWTPQGSFERSDIQEVFLALLCLESAMPFGGTITVTRPDDAAVGWEVSGPAQTARPSPAVWETLKTGEGVDAVMPAHVQFALLPALVQERFGKIGLVEAEDSLTIQF